MVFTADQQIAIIAALLGGNLAIAAILFGVLGFLYAVYANMAVPHLPNEPIEKMQIPVLPHRFLQKSRDYVDLS
jgi:hypothetical protein